MSASIPANRSSGRPGGNSPRMLEAPIRGSYQQIFPPTRYDRDTTAGRSALGRLAQTMVEKKQQNASSLPTGYTYFGQFIDHDLTWNQTEIEAPRKEQISASNFRTSFLDLDHVYGDGPPRPGQYIGPPGEERFVIRPCAAAPNFGLAGGSEDDIPADGRQPLIGDGFDFRNAENIIVRQLHVIFLKFHNAVMREFPKHQDDPNVPNSGTLFSRARRLVTWVYQWLIWNDFLARLWTSGTFRYPNRSTELCPATDYKLPLEFALAGFRFGHSMVRDFYPLNCHHPINQPASLLELINPHKDSIDPLPADYVVEWGAFFPSLLTSTRQIEARRIDTAITDALSTLPKDTVRLFSRQSSEEPVNLPYRTLLRGARAGIASGREAFEFLRDQGIDIPPITTELQADPALQETGLTDDPPLWYYILKEAETKYGSFGSKLGPLGTWLVSTTIEQSLQYDGDSYLNQCGPDWTPPCWILPEQNRSIGALIKFAGADKLSEGCQNKARPKSDEATG